MKVEEVVLQEASFPEYLALVVFQVHQVLLVLVDTPDHLASVVSDLLVD